MSDHIDCNGKRYYAAEYFKGVLKTSKRRKKRIAELEGENKTNNFAATTYEQDIKKLQATIERARKVETQSSSYISIGMDSGCEEFIWMKALDVLAALGDKPEESE